MKKNSTISIPNDKGENKNYRIITTFEIEENDNKYIIYTDDVEDEDGYKKAYAGILNEENDKLDPIESEEEWEIINEVLKKIEKGIK